LSKNFVELSKGIAATIVLINDVLPSNREIENFADSLMSNLDPTLARDHQL
jgi:hypothetical protein